MITEPIPSLLQGMTQQAPELRNANKADFQSNFISDPAAGLARRAGTDHVRKVPGLQNPNQTFVKWIRRDETEKYCVTFDGVALRVFGLDGREYIVQADAAAISYISASNPKKKLRSLTLADTTLILNTEKTVAMSPDVSPALAKLAVVWIKQGNYGQTYTVRLAEGDAYDTTPDGSVSGHVAEIRTSKIADRLVNGGAPYDGTQTLLKIGSVSGSYTVTYTAGDSYFLIKKTDDSDFTIEGRDSIAGNGVGVCKNSARSFASLPPIAPDGYIASVLGNQDDSADDYWVKFSLNRSTSPDGKARGQWAETLAPGVKYKLDASTMPHRLNRKQDDYAGTVTGTPYAVYFTFEPCVWGEREVGDTDTSPDPSFVGNQIRNLFVFQNRLGFLFKSNVVMSRTGDYFHFFRHTVTKVLDTDPIDGTVAPGRLTDDRVLNLDNALAFAQELLLIGDRVQIVVPGSEPLTPASFRALLASSLEAYPDCRPVMSETSAFIPYTTGSYVGLREFLLDGNANKFSFSDTAEIPRLIPGAPDALAICSSQSTMIVLSTDDPTNLYVFRWLDEGRSRVQAAWGVWSFGDPILSCEVLETTLWMLVNRPEGPTLESMEIPYGIQSELDARFPIHLDRKVPFGTARMRSPSIAPAGSGADPIGGTVTAPPGGGGGPLPGDPNSNRQPWNPDDGSVNNYITEGSGATTSTDPAAVSAGNPSGASRDRGIISYDSARNVSVLQFPYDPPSSVMVIRADTMQSLRWVVGQDPKTIEVSGDMRQLPLYGGTEFSCVYTFGPATVISSSTSGGSARLRSGRVRVHKWAVVGSSCGAFELIVASRNRPDVTKIVTPKQIGSVNITSPVETIGSVFCGFAADRCRVSIRCTGYWPVVISSAFWTGEIQSDHQIR